MKPLLAHIYEDKRWIGGPCWLQPKFNGVRALYQNGRFQSRDELPWNVNVLAHIAGSLMQLFSDPHLILDGELYVHGWPLQRINGAVAINRLEPNEDTLKVGYWVFDQVKYNTPFFVRFNEIQGTIRGAAHPNIFAATTVSPPNRQWVEDFYAETISQGFEGIMYRLGLCPYTVPKQPKENNPGFLSDKHNRTWHLLKRKAWMDDEFECIAVEEGEGKRAGKVGAFICAIDEGQAPGFSKLTFGVGSGLTDAEAQHYFDNPPIGRKIKVKYLCLTSDGIPFNPTIEAVL